MGVLGAWSADLGMELPGNDFALPTIYGAMLTGGGPKRGSGVEGSRPLAMAKGHSYPARGAGSARQGARRGGKEARRGVYC